MARLPLVLAIIAMPLGIVLCHAAAAESNISTSGLLDELGPGITEHDFCDVVRVAGRACRFFLVITYLPKLGFYHR